MSKEVFDRAVKARRDVTDTFFGEFGFEPRLSSAMIESEKHLCALFREKMLSGRGVGRLFNLKDEAKPFLKEARALLNDGKVGAVDGTTALPKIDFMNATLYACAIAWVTSRQRGKPNVSITETSSDYADPDRIRMASDAEIKKICDELDDARDSESWPTTFREYEERRVAIRTCEADVVLIDGPIFTQNLITQTAGRDLLTELIGSPKSYVGVIKNLSGSWAECRWCASALATGEGYVLCPVGQPIQERATRGGQHEIIGWLPRTNDFVRVVFRPAEKFFAFECRKDQLGLACAILELNASPTIGHELPLLMETVDAQLRSGFDADLARKIMLGRIMREKGGYRPAIDATDEREFR